MAVKKTIKIKKYSDVIEEFVAVGIVTPGHLIMLDSAGKVKAHNVAGGNVLPMFPVEDQMQGKGIDDNYAVGDQVQCWIPGRGDIVNAILADGQNVVIGDFLESAGNGTLQKHVADVNDSGESDNILGNQIVGQVVESVDLSGSSGTHPETGLRVKVRIY